MTEQLNQRAILPLAIWMQITCGELRERGKKAWAERDADQANANLSGPTIGFVVSTIVFLAYPLAQRISDAFGG